MEQNNRRLGAKSQLLQVTQVFCYVCSGPAIDAMYLPKSTAMPLRPANQIRSTQMLPVKTRISKDIVQNQQGLVTSYFPQQK